MKRLTALLLALVCLLTACQTAVKTPETQSTEAETVEATTEELQTSLTEVVRLQNQGKRSYLPEEPIAMVPFEEMKFYVPDTQEIYTGFDELTAQVENGASAQEILSGYYRLYDLVSAYNTMYILSYLRYEVDTRDFRRQTEHNSVSPAQLFVERKLETFYMACAQSDQRQSLEEAYFGEGFFEDYEQEALTLQDDYVNLSTDESNCITRYQMAIQDPRITYNDRLQSVSQLLSSGEDPLDVYTEYYRQYNEKLGEIMVELLELRREEAKLLGYKTYAEYAYDQRYGRDYTVEEARAYLAAVAEYLAPLYSAAKYYDFESYEAEMDEKAVRMALQQAAEAMGGVFADAYEFMDVYHLADLTICPGKVSGSFTSYLPDYEAPFILVEAEGSSDDLMTLTHEFGHFLDSFATYNADEDIETAEVFSQAFEFLMLENTGNALSNRQKRMLRNDQIFDALRTIVEQAMFASFELRIYDLENPTLEDINEAYYEASREFGVLSFEGAPGDYANIDRWNWIDINHFFTQPCYVISYSISADAAVQVYAKEVEQPGQGTEVYLALLERQEGQGLQEVLTQAGLESPLDADRVKALSELFRDLLS